MTRSGFKTAQKKSILKKRKIIIKNIEVKKKCTQNIVFQIK